MQCILDTIQTLFIAFISTLSISSKPFLHKRIGVTFKRWVNTSKNQGKQKIKPRNNKAKMASIQECIYYCAGQLLNGFHVGLQASWQ